MTLDQWLSVGNIFISIVIAVIVYCISNRLSAKDKYEHEIRISDQLNKVLGKKVILADVKKYNSNNNNVDNTNYSKQACDIHHVIQNYGVVVSLRDHDKPALGLIPFNWIEYVRQNDSEDNCYIVVCKFKGIKWYNNFRSPIKEILKSGI